MRNAKKGEITMIEKLSKSKVLSIVLLVCFAVTTFLNVTLPQTASAAPSGGESTGDIIGTDITIKAQNDPTIKCVKLDGKPQLGRFAYYSGLDANNQQQNYPAYCVMPNNEGVNQAGNYSVEAYKLADHPRVYGAIINGYPYVSNDSLGITESLFPGKANLAAYYATRNVAWSMTEGWDISQWTSDGTPQGDAVLAAMQQIYNKAKNWQANPYFIEVNVGKVTGDQAVEDSKDSQYVSTTYTITSNAKESEIKKIEVKLQSNGSVSSAKIVDMNNNPKTSFKVGEQFKVIALKSEVEAAKSVQLTLDVMVEANELALIYGRTNRPEFQDYYLTRDPIGRVRVPSDFLYNYEGGGGEVTPPGVGEDGELTIIKQDAGNNNALAGAEFEVLMDGTAIGRFTTGTDGTIHIPIDGNTMVGYVDEHDGQTKYRPKENGQTHHTYTIREITPPFGYLLSRPSEQTVVTKADGEGGLTEETMKLVVTFKNDPYGNINIVKTDKETGASLAGAVFRVTYLQGAHDDYSFTTDVTTDGSGAATISELKPGSYKIEEITAPPHYVLNSKVETITVTAGKTVTYSATNSMKPGLHIMKIDEEEQVAVSGTTFNIRGIDNDYNQDYVTDAQGEIHLEDMQPGSYVVTETVAAPGYALDPTNKKTVELTAGDTSIQLVFYNHKLAGLVLTKIDKVSQKPLPNVTFHVTEKGGKEVGDFTTDQNGQIILENLPEGWYTLTEINVPDGVIIDKTPHDVYVKNGKVTEIQLENSKKPHLILKKLDSVVHGPVQYAKFDLLYAGEDSKGEYEKLGTYTTDENGQIDFGLLEVGWYKLIETEVPAGYQKKEPIEQTFYLEADQEKTVTFENTPLNAIAIKKIDADNGDPLQGAKFRLRYLGGTSGTGGTIVGEYVTSANGTIVITGLEAGTYLVEEIQAPPNYTITNAVQTVYLSGNDQDTITVEFTNKKISGLLVRKLDAETDEPLAGAEFKITTSSGTVVGDSNGIFRTDESGYIHLPNIPDGTYVVQEVKAPEGYLLDNTPQTVKLEKNQTATLTFYDKPKGGIIIRKLDADTKEPLAGADFKVTDSKGLVIGDGNGIYTTDESGFIHLTDVHDTTLVVQEVKAPDGYILDNTPQTVKVEAGTTHTLTFYNEPKGGVIIRKLDGNTKEPLAGATFKVTDSSGAVVGASNGIYTTDASGYIHISDIKDDTIVVEEVKAPDGYVLDNTPQTVKIKAGETHTVTFYNYHKGGLNIIKIDSETREPLKGAEFEVRKMNGEVIGTYTTDRNGEIHLNELTKGWYEVTEKKAPKGYTLDKQPHKIEVTNDKTAVLEIENSQQSSVLIHKIDSDTKEGIYGVKFLVSDAQHNPIGTYETDQNGYVYIDHELEDGKYYVREIEAAEGYQLDTKERTFYLRYGSTEEIIWENTAEKGQIQIVKKSADINPTNGLPANTVLPNAVFTITNSKGKVVDTIKTDSRGIAVSKLLPLGYYTIEEIQAPNYYAKSDEVITAHIEFSSQVVKFEVLNKSLYTNVAVDKKGYMEAMAGQSIRYDFPTIANNSNVPLANFYWRDTLPTDAVRLEKISTGTWNQALNYKIMYKTNLRDYRLLKDNLLTTQNYILDCSANALGLASGEYITEFMFNFGMVQGGFANMESPSISCVVKTTLPHDYQFTNKTDVGGLYNNNWIMANDWWTTKVYNKLNPPTLPKTGY